ncbi:hypothetical protein BN3456_00038 [Clostridium sp. C105KSO13]|nr:hypothetical protein BN3456_00038 [Clostridium sp. C105KSO13]
MGLSDYNYLRKMLGYKEIALTERQYATVSYTHLRAHETSLHLVCRLLLEKKKETPEKISASDDLTKQTKS